MKASQIFGLFLGAVVDTQMFAQLRRLNVDTLVGFDGSHFFKTFSELRVLRLKEFLDVLEGISSPFDVSLGGWVFVMAELHYGLNFSQIEPKNPLMEVSDELVMALMMLSLSACALLDRHPRSGYPSDAELSERQIRISIA